MEITFSEYILRNGLTGFLQKDLEMKERELKTLKVRKKRTERKLGRRLAVVKSFRHWRLEMMSGWWSGPVPRTESQPELLSDHVWQGSGTVFIFTVCKRLSVSV